MKAESVSWLLESAYREELYPYRKIMWPISQKENMLFQYFKNESAKVYRKLLLITFCFQVGELTSKLKGLACFEDKLRYCCSSKEIY